MNNNNNNSKKWCINRVVYYCNNDMSPSSITTYGPYESFKEAEDKAVNIKNTNIENDKKDNSSRWVACGFQDETQVRYYICKMIND